MKLIIKKLNGEECELQVLPTTQIIEIKRQIALRLHIPVSEQKLLFLGRTLLDEQKIETYPNLKDGSKLNLVVKIPDKFFDVLVKCYKKKGKSDDEAKAGANRILTAIEDRINNMSWDDLNKLSQDCLVEMYHGNDNPSGEADPDAGDSYVL